MLRKGGDLVNQKKTLLLVAAALACIAAAGFLTRHFRGSWGDPVPTAVAGPALNTVYRAPAESEDEKDLLVYGYISGAVRHVGVFPLPQGARIFQLVEAAGGFLPDADTSRVNLAAPVRDGVHLHIHLVGEKASSAPTSPVITPIKGSSLIYVNLATEQELTLLPGVGGQCWRSEL